MKHHITKPLIILAIALTSFVFIWMYINDTLQKAKASADLVNVSFVPAAASNNVNENYNTDVIIQAQSTKKISGVDMTLSYTGSLQIIDISNPVPLNTGDTTFFTQLRKETIPGKVRIASVAKKTEGELPQAVKVRVTYRSTQTPGGKILVNTAELEVAGNTTDGKFSIGTVGDFTSTVASPSITPVQITPTNAPTPIVTPTTIILGTTHYASGSIQNGPSGSTITVYATGARPNFPYRLVAGKGTTVNPCSTEVTELITTPINASANGDIANTTAVIDKAPGVWQICFRTSFNSGYNITSPVNFSVAPISPTLAPLSDLIVTGMQITYDSSASSFVCSTGLGIRVTIKNQGLGPVNGSFSVKTNNTTSRTISGGLAAGISASVWIPGYESSGANTAVVDSGNEINESNETNNLSSQVIPVPTQPAACLISPTLAITPVPCALKAKGDANCDDTIDLIDFEIWRKEFMGEKVGKDADFNSDNKIDLIDFEIWRKNRI